MPPKKQAQGASKKTEQKKKEKIIEDKTFGLKNKKGAKQQTYIKNVTQQVKSGGQKSARQLQQEQEESRSKKKDQKKKEQEELNALFRPVQKVSKGADPKSIVCAFYKQGACSKGDKCKFSHDLTMERKAEKRSLYVDTRDDEERKQDSMDTWDDAKLAEVVAEKHGDQSKKQQTSTDIVCKFFLQAIEDGKYGWFWVCPNGGDKCMYRHALPPGFVLKKNKKKDPAEEEDTITMEELIEEERAKLGANHPKITLESFLDWKRKKLQEKKKKLDADVKRRKEDFKQGKALGISGREVFEFKPEMADADDEGADDVKYKREEDEEGEEPVKVSELTLEALAASATTSDQAGATIATSNERTGETSSLQPGVENHLQKDNPSQSGKNISELNGPLENNTDESNKLDQAAALPVDDTQAAIAAAQAALIDNTGVQIDEQLFTDDVPVDEQLFDAELDDLDEDLETLDLQD